MGAKGRHKRLVNFFMSVKQGKIWGGQPKNVKPQKFNFTTFENASGDDMIVQTGIPFHSLCEHHLAPFFGFASVAYIPKNELSDFQNLLAALITLLDVSRIKKE